MLMIHYRRVLLEVVSIGYRCLPNQRSAYCVKR
uniref:Uncharacterized protein n=1 Tax=Anguilla anguilla TaxID=7936 RepID=A0A0E9PY04_ANGAN